MNSSQELILFYVIDDNSYDLKFLMIELINDKNRYSHTLRSFMRFCSTGAETAEYAAQACESCSVPNHGTVERQLIAIPSPT